MGQVLPDVLNFVLTRIFGHTSHKIGTRNLLIPPRLKF